LVKVGDDEVVSVVDLGEVAAVVGNLGSEEAVSGEEESAVVEDLGELGEEVAVVEERGDFDDEGASVEDFGRESVDVLDGSDGVPSNASTTLVSARLAAMCSGVCCCALRARQSAPCASRNRTMSARDGEWEAKQAMWSGVCKPCSGGAKLIETPLCSTAFTCSCVPVAATR